MLKYGLSKDKKKRSCIADKKKNVILQPI